MTMARIPMTGGFSPMEEGSQVLRIYGADYSETFGKLTVYLCNAKAQTLRETFRFKGAGNVPNEAAMNAFSFFAKTAMQDYDMEDVDPQDLVGRYIRCEVVHNQGNDGRTYANLGRDKEPADGFDGAATKEALTMLWVKKAEKPEAKPAAKQPEAPKEAAPAASSYSLDDLLG